MTESHMFRNFYPVEQYLNKGGIKKNSEVLILTDDEAAIEEAVLLHPNYQWKYFNKARNRGVKDSNSHFPSNDEALETLTVLAEMQVASQCQKGVFGSSKFPLLIQMAMAKRHRREDIKNVKIDVGISQKPKEDAGKFMQELEAKLARARMAAQQRERRTNDARKQSP